MHSWWWIYRFCYGVFLVGLLLSPESVIAQCKPGDILVGEDERYYYCASPKDGILVKSEQSKLDQNYDTWLNNRQQEVFDVVQSNTTWRGGQL